MPLFGIDGVEVEMEQSEIDAHIAQLEIDAHNKMNRQERDRLLSETDWWASSDLTMTQAQIDYRQALRDVPQQEGWPTDITWPTKPE